MNRKLLIEVIVILSLSTYHCLAQEEGSENLGKEKRDKVSFSIGPGFLLNYIENENTFSISNLGATINFSLDYRIGYHFENGIELDVIIPAYTIKSYVEDNYMESQGYPLVYINTNPESYPDDPDYYPYPYDDGNFYYQRQFGELRLLPSLMANWHFKLYFQEFNSRYTNFYFGGQASGLFRNIRLVRKTDIITRFVSGSGEIGEYLSEELNKKIIAISILPELQLGVILPMSYTTLLDISIVAGGNLHNLVGQFKIGFRF